MSDQRREPTRDVIAEVWKTSRVSIDGRIRTIETALAGELDAKSRSEAHMEAHRLAGSLGVFGYPDGSRIAHAIELELAAEEPLSDARLEHLRELARRLRAEMSGAL